MENAVEAFMLAFAVAVLIIALSVTLFMFSQARQTSDLMLHLTDPKKYYSYVEANGIEVDNLGNRIVGMETVIPTLYRYSKEDIKITFRSGTASYDSDGKITNVSIGRPIEIYKTQTDPELWSTGYKNDFDDTGTSTSICSFDLKEEQSRREPWTGAISEVKKNLDAILAGETYENMYYTSIGFAKRFNQAKFVEMVGEVVTVKAEDDENSGIRGNKTTTKKVITYVMIN